MTKFRSKYRIEPNRCKYWDYSAPGKYFLTICINKRECILGNVVNKKMELSKFGEFVETEIRKISQYNPRIILDEWKVMPNHIHLIIELGEYNYNNRIANADDHNGNGNVVGNGNVEKIHEFSLPTPQPTPQPTSPPTSPPASQPTPNQQWWNNHDYKPTIDEIKQYRKQRRKMIIPKILGKLKMKTSKQMNDARKTPGQKNWQSDYHDHIIRDDQSYQRIKNYIRNNPKNWNKDTFNEKPVTFNCDCTK
jgi:REP element-mobilizing transposase RayT